MRLHVANLGPKERVVHRIGDAVSGGHYNPFFHGALERAGYMNSIDHGGVVLTTRGQLKMLFFVLEWLFQTSR